MKYGFTLIELLIVIGITLILAVAAIPIYGNLQVSAQLNETSAQIIQAIRTAKERSGAGYNDIQHGVYFDINANGQDSYILYQGVSYAARQSSYDRATLVENSMSINNSTFTLTGNHIDINFSKGLTVPNNTGTLILSHASEGSRNILVNSAGLVEED